MDNRLIPTILFVTLCWISMGSYSVLGQNTTVASITNGTNSTTAAPSNANSTTVATGNANSTTVATGNANSTTVAPSNTNGTNSTTVAPSNANSTTVAPSNANSTTVAPSNTNGTNSTTAAPSNTTTAPTLTPNTTVTLLQTPLSRAQCGNSQLCASQPSTCNPSSGSCFFLSAQRTSGNNFQFGLAGQSSGYIAATLSSGSTLGNNDTTYICANNNSAVQFFSTLLNNNTLIPTTLNVNSVMGQINGSTIQCTFAATLPTIAVTKDAASTFGLAISSGSFNAATGALGSPIIQLRSAAVDLGNPNTTVINQLNTNTTAAPTVPSTTAHAITLRQSLTQALLITVGVLGLAML